jgi:hypothetical protein
MQTHQASAALHVCLECGLVAIGQISHVAAVDHHDVGFLQILARRRMQPAVDHRAAFGE